MIGKDEAASGLQDLIDCRKDVKDMKKRYLHRSALLLAGVFLWNMPSGSCAALSLADAVEMALNQNTSILIKQKGEDTAAAVLRQARGNKSFSVSATGGLTGTKNSGTDRTDTGNIGLTAKLPIYSGGKYEAAIKSGEIGVQSAKLLTEREREDIRLSVVKAYYDALQAQKTVNVNQDTVDKYQAHLTNVEQLYSAGSKARIDVLRSSVELSNARQTLIKSQNTYEVDLANLRNILNMDRSEPLTLTDDFSYSPFNREMGTCIDYAMDNRKDLLVDQYTLEQKKLAVKQAKAGYLPTLSMSVGTSLSDQYQPSTDHKQSYTAGLSASWDVFDSGVTRGQVDAAKTDEAVAALNLQKDQEDIDYAVRQAYYNMREAEKRFNSTQDAVNQAQEDYFIAREKYRAGEGLMLDIIDAQLALSTAQLNYISAQYDYARYKATVENAMGLGIGETADTASAAAANATATAAAAAEPAAPAAVKPVAEVQTAQQPTTAQLPAADETAEAGETAEAAAENGVTE